MITIHVGVDDTDSPRIGCTTYVVSILVEKLASLGVHFIDYPNLVRLNPNVPWKTRGNGALCLRFNCKEGQIEEIKEIVLDVVERYSDLDYAGTEPGVVFLEDNVISQELKTFAKQAIQGIVGMRDALKLIKACKAEAVGFKTGRGIIGALASVGETLTEDYTYELISYRTPNNRGTPRRIDIESIFEMDQATKPSTFNNVDPETRRILITPRGPDPILYGIRGETASIVKRAKRMVRSLEPIERWTVFRTNHGTDAHLREVASIMDVHTFNPVIVKGAVSKSPWIVPRRHVVFTLRDATGQIDCAAYEPTGDLRKTAQHLLTGDIIEAHGGVRPASKNRPITINLEKIKILELAKKAALQNPLCPRCTGRMKSMGKGQGFRCDRCGLRSKSLKKTVTEEKRDLEKRLYVASARSQRHLTKPLDRYGIEAKGQPKRMVSKWFWVRS